MCLSSHLIEMRLIWTFCLVLVVRIKRDPPVTDLILISTTGRSQLVEWDPHVPGGTAWPRSQESGWERGSESELDLHADCSHGPAAPVPVVRHLWGHGPELWAVSSPNRLAIWQRSWTQTSKTFCRLFSCKGCFQPDQNRRRPFRAPIVQVKWTRFVQQRFLMDHSEKLTRIVTKETFVSERIALLEISKSQPVCVFFFMSLSDTLPWLVLMIKCSVFHSLMLQAKSWKSWFGIENVQRNWSFCRFVLDAWTKEREQKETTDLWAHARGNSQDQISDANGRLPLRVRQTVAQEQMEDVAGWDPEHWNSELWFTAENSWQIKTWRPRRIWKRRWRSRMADFHPRVQKL